MNLRFWSVWLLPALLMGSLSSMGCTQPEGLMDVNLSFAGHVGEVAYSCDGTYTEVGTSGSMLEFDDFRLFISGVRLTRADGSSETLQLVDDGQWQSGGVTLLDFAEGCTTGDVDSNDVIRGRVPVGEYVGVTFTLGIPFDQNHIDQTRASAPLNISSMFWSWQAGYKFLRLDGRSSTAGGDPAVDGWRVHIGSTGCDGDVRGNVTMCANPNRPEITLTRFDASTQRIIVDTGALLANADLESNAEGTPEGCMGDPSDADCTPILEALGLSDDATQTFFRVE